MRPIQLTMDYFGPFKKETIDFTQLQSVPLFLITGKTGSGKTTIFDAMSVALFGTTSGDKRKAEELRSDWASDDAITCLNFTFEHQHKFYHIKRSPKQKIAKKRGNGLREMSAVAECTIYDAAGEEIRHIDGVKPVNQFIVELLHLNQKQFTQFVLLPQGAFRHFLESDSNEKEQILRELFGTQSYNQIVAVLAERVKQMKKENEQSVLALDHYLKQLEVESLADLPKVHQRQEELLAQKQALATQLKDYQEQVKAAYESYEKSKQIAQQLERFAALQQEQQTLNQKEEAIAKLQQTVAENEYIAQYLSLFEEVEELAQKQQEWQQKVKVNQATLEEKKTQCEALQQEYQALQSQEDAMKQKEWQLHRLQEEMQQIQAAKNCQAELMDVNKQLEQQETLQQQLNNQLDQLVTIEQEQQAVLQQEASLREQQMHLQTEQLSWQQQCRIADEWQELEENQRKIGVQRQQLSQQDEQLSQHLQNLMQEQTRCNDEILLAEINDLAKQLSPDAPCPLCGSLNHPHPHQINEQLADVSELKKQQQTIGQKITVAHRDIAELEKQLNTLSDKGSNALQSIEKYRNDTQKESVDLLLVALNAEREKIVLAEQQQAQLASDIQQAQQKRQQAMAEMEKVQSQLETVRTTIQQQQNRLVQLQTTLQSLPEIDQQAEKQQQMNELQQQVEQYQQSYRVIQAQLTEQQEQLQQVQQAQITLTTQLNNYREQWQKRQSELQEKMDQYHLAKEWFGDRKPELAQLDSQKKAIQSYQEAVLKNQMQLQELQPIVTVQNQQLAGSLTTIYEKYQHKQQLMTEYQSQLSQLEVQWQNQNKLLQEVEQLMETQQAHIDKLEEMQTLYEGLAGKSSRSNVSLERFVLQKTFSEVLEIANHRLQKLTNQRYRLLLNGNSQSRINRSGLELEVYDDYSGVARSVSTLSGGEGFIIALALALSFGDLIQQKIGSVQIETLFIDEGFGTLDEESLDVALKALEEIETEGRVIGIISHVNELKQRIPQQIQVKECGNGMSRIQLQTS